jgi:hypothetical protein
MAFSLIGGPEDERNTRNPKQRGSTPDLKRDKLANIVCLNNRNRVGKVGNLEALRSKIEWDGTFADVLADAGQVV